MKFYCIIFFTLAACYSCSHKLMSIQSELTSSIELDTTLVRSYLKGLQQDLKRSPGDSNLKKKIDLTETYLKAAWNYEIAGWDWARKASGYPQIGRYVITANLLKELAYTPSHPLYYKTLYLRGRIAWWLQKEAGFFHPDTISANHFEILSEKFPHHEILQMYLGKQIPFNAKYYVEEKTGAPTWAVYQREAMYRILQVIHWWVNDRQIENGELGGKYGDDVEILRWWLPAILGADDSTATLGYTRLADGVWNSDLLERGFSKKVDDVEHSAEFFRDTHPAMLMMKYGDPEYVERCMISMQNFEKVWTAVNSYGHRHFKSYYLSATDVRDYEPYGVDVPLNARAVLGGLWLAWYNRDPALLSLFGEWCKAWIEDARREENGKPKGVIPAAVVFKTDKIGGYTGTWYDAELTYPYYKWESIGHIGELYTHLLGIYAITKDSLYLEPVKSLIDIIEDKNIEANENIPGSLPWVKSKLIRDDTTEDKKHPLSNTLSMARKVTGNSALDNIVLRFGSPYSKYEVSKKTGYVLKGFDRVFNSLRYNLPLLTTEAKFTDRVYVHGSDVLFGMYTGHFGNGFEYPALVATWKNTGPDVSVFVRDGDRVSASASLFNAGPEKKIEMRSWFLEPGQYTITEGEDDNDDGIIDKVTNTRTLKLPERVNSVEIVVPSKKNYVISIKQLQSSATNDSLYPDPAIASRDIVLSDTVFTEGQPIDISATIHNIGSKNAENITVQLSTNGNIIDSVKVSSIQAPINLNFTHKKIDFKIIAKKGMNEIGVKIISPQQEITDLNNYATKKIMVR